MDDTEQEYEDSRAKVREFGTNSCVNVSSPRMIVLPPALTTWPSGSKTRQPWSGSHAGRTSCARPSRCIGAASQATGGCDCTRSVHAEAPAPRGTGA